MPSKGRFTRLDAFSKTVDEARLRTTSGGIVTIASLLIMFWLVWGEWADWRKVIVRPELVVDKGRGEIGPTLICLSIPPEDDVALRCQWGLER